MIKVNHVTKRFDGFEALKHMNCNITDWLEVTVPEKVHF